MNMVNAPPGADQDVDVRLDDLLGYTFRRIQIRMSQHLTEQFSDFRLRPGQFSAMLILEQLPGITQVDLARNLAMEPSQVVQLITKLERRALVIRQRGLQDRRANFLNLSEEGLELVKKLKIVALRSDEVVCSALSDDEKAHLHLLLAKML
ncbi:MarR family winged helix-turn-helix transcriptional regulator [Pseudomonas lini]